MNEPSGHESQAPSKPIDLPKVVSADQVRFYVDNGYLVVPDLIEAGELDELKRDTVRIALGDYPCEALTPLPAGTTQDEALRSILCIHMPHYVSPLMLKYVQHPKVCGVLSQIVGAHLPWWDGSVKCMQSMLFVKPPGFQGQAWHQDEIYIPTRDRTLCGAWIAMDDATIDNGCLWVLPGSHRKGYLYAMRPHENPDEFDSGEMSWGFDESSQVPVEVKAGALVFFNGYLLHRSQKNRSGQYRRVLVNHYMNAWSFLPWHFEEGLGMAQQDDRCIVPVSGTDPYAWKGYKQTPQNVHLRQCKANEEQAGDG